MAISLLEMPRELSIIIVSWNVKTDLQACLRSIFDSLPKDRIEVFVVDNHSSDDSAGMVEKEFSLVHLIRNTANRGFSAANNQAMKLAQGKIILLLNPDTFFIDASIMDFIGVMAHRERIGVAGCQLLNPDHSIQSSVRRFPNLGSQVTVLLKLHVLFPALPWMKRYLAKDFDYTKPSIVDQVKGAAFFIHRRAIDRIGLLDEKFWIWFEEVDYCRRAVNSGLEVWYSPMAKIVHRQGDSFRQVPSFQNQRRLNKSMATYFRKHHSMLSFVTILLLQPLSLVIAALATLVPGCAKDTLGIRA